MGKIQKFDLLVSVYIFCILVAETLGAKTIPVVNILGKQFNASVSVFLLIFIYTANDIITEVYGKERARSVIRSGLLMVFFLFVFAMLATALPPSTRFVANEAAYDTIFRMSARISAASLIAFAAGELLDVAIYSRIREKLGKSKLWLRNNLSNFLAQLIDTVVFYTLAFYALDKGLGDNVSFLFSIMFPYYLLKCTVSVLETPLVYLGVKWLKKE